MKNNELTYIKIIIFAIVTGVYTAIMALIPFFKDTSFTDITISFEVWILFGVYIIMHSKSAKDSAIKCFLFFLISQPLVYLIQVPFSSMGFSLFNYYKRWFIYTILTIPMGYIGYYLKKDKWWCLFILTPILIFLGVHYSTFLKEVIFKFPCHLLSTIFCFITILLYPLCIFKNKTIKFIELILSIIIIITMTIWSLLNRINYKTIILTSEPDTFIFDNSYSAYLENKKYGNVKIRYDEGLEDYIIESNFIKGGKTKLIIEDNNGNKTEFELQIDYNNFIVNKN